MNSLNEYLKNRKIFLVLTGAIFICAAIFKRWAMWIICLSAILYLFLKIWGRKNKKNDKKGYI